MIRISYIPLLLVLFFLGISTSYAAPIYPKLTGQIVDRANMLSTSEKQILLGKLKALEKKSSDQLVIVTLPSLQGYDIAEFSIELARHWKIGQKDTDNGILLVIAPKERKMRIEVGYGLEGTVPDSLANNIIVNRIRPAFKRGKMFEGIDAGVTDLVDLLLGNKAEAEARAKARPSHNNNDGSSIFFIIFAFFFGLPFILNFFNIGADGKKGGGVFIIPGRQASNNRHNGGYSGGWSSGGWSGGGGGGFSGGGGSFGGGGASGGW